MLFQTGCEIRSWQLASGFVSQRLQMQRAFYASAVGKLPCRKVLDSGLLAGIVFGALPGCAALDVIHVLESITKQFFLVGAVRAPPRPVHLRAAFRDTLRESIQSADWLAIVGKIIKCPCDNHDRKRDDEPSQSRCRIGSCGWALVQVRHCEFLYHDIKGAGQHVEAFAMNCHYFAINHHINRGVEMKIHPAHLANLGQRMPGVSAIVKCRQVAN